MNAADTRTSPIDVSAIPSELRASARVVVWNRVHRDGKDTKVPHDPKHPDRLAAVDNPQTWSSFTTALSVVQSGRADGLGVVLGEGLIGADLDGCRDPETGAIEPWAAVIIQALNSYTEVSPSGRGIHTLAYGVLPPGGRRKGPIELYSEGRYFTVTGLHVEGTPRAIHQRTEALTRVHARVFETATRRTPTPRPPVTPVTLADSDLLAKAESASNGSKFSALWAGDSSRYPSASEADQALANLLAFWTGCDSSRMDRLFRQSGLMREKWDERRGRETYGERTIACAIEGCRETYTAGVLR